MDVTAYLRRVVTTLSREIGIRTYRDGDRMARAADFIAAELSACGLPVTRQDFLAEGSALQNVVAEVTGGRDPGTVPVIGAHYDTVRTTPGADDNASGVAGMLALARTLAGRTPDRTIRFAAFAFEEPPAYRTPNMGSYHYARSLKERGELIDGMICLEMIGFFSDRKGSQQYPLPFMSLRFPDRGNYIAMVGDGRSRAFTERIADSFRRATDLPVVTLNAPAFVVGIDFSDHWSFHRFGMHAFMVTDTAFYRNPHYHLSSDLPETLDYERMAKVVTGLAAAVDAWSGGVPGAGDRP